MGQAKLKAIKKVEAIRLDIGCGKNKRAGFVGIDAMKFDGVDHVLDVRKTPWPWPDESIDEVFSSHFVEHLTGAERIPFFNELYRVMKVGAQAQIITPDWSNACAYGDPTHQWPPMSGWYPFYLHKPWREGVPDGKGGWALNPQGQPMTPNAPHVGYTCDFDFQNGIGWDQSVMTRNEEWRGFAAAHYVNAARDLYVNLTKRPKA